MWRKRERRLDTRNAMLRYQLVCCWAKDPPKWEAFFPDEAEQQETADERMTRKLDLVMASFGGVLPANRATEVRDPADDEFCQKMWRLMGVTE